MSKKQKGQVPQQNQSPGKGSFIPPGQQQGVPPMKKGGSVKKGKK